MADIFTAIADNKQIKSRFLENLSLFSLQSMYVIAQDDSTRNKGLPMVDHCIKTGLVKNIKIKILFFKLPIRKITMIGKLIT